MLRRRPTIDLSQPPRAALLALWPPPGPTRVRIGDYFANSRDCYSPHRGDVVWSWHETQRQAPDADESAQPQRPEARAALPGERLGDLPDPPGEIATGPGQCVPPGQGRERLARFPRRRLAGRRGQPAGRSPLTRRAEAPQPGPEDRPRGGPGHPGECPLPRLRGGHESP